MARYIVVRESDLTILNAVEWNGLEQWQAPEGCLMRETTDGDIGERWTDDRNRSITQAVRAAMSRVLRPLVKPRSTSNRVTQVKPPAARPPVPSQLRRMLAMFKKTP